MIVPYSIYHNTKQIHDEKFRYMWNKYEPFLECLPTSIFRGNDLKACTFNNWLRFCTQNELLVLDVSKMFTHSFQFYVNEKLASHMPIHVRDFLAKGSNDFLFVFSYQLTFRLLNDIESHVDKEKFQLKYVNEFYLLTDEDLDHNHPIYNLFKHLNTVYLQERLTAERCGSLFHLSINATNGFFKYIQNEKLV